MKLADVDRKKLLSLVDSLARAVEDLLLAGLTTASDATRRTLDVSFQEASRMRLLRLGSTLRVANEELRRYTSNDAEFSRRRLSFFLNRSWLLARGLARAVREGDDASFAALLYIPPSQSVKKVEVVTLGVVKKFVKDSFCSFDFRLRTITSSDEMAAGHSLVWSCIFPLKAGTKVPPEGFLHLPQRQKFKPFVFLEGNSIVVENAAVALDQRGGGRLIMGEKTKVRQGAVFSDWQQFTRWNAAPAVQRVAAYQPGPFDLEVDLQEEIVLDEWSFGDEPPSEIDGQLRQTIIHRDIVLSAVASRSAEGEALRQQLKSLRKKKSRPPLFGLMHYAMCRLVLQPLSIIETDGPMHLMISEQNVDRKALLSALDFR